MTKVYYITETGGKIHRGMLMEFHRLGVICHAYQKNSYDILTTKHLNSELHEHQQNLAGITILRVHNIFTARIPFHRPHGKPYPDHQIAHTQITGSKHNKPRPYLIQRHEPFEPYLTHRQHKQPEYRTKINTKTRTAQNKRGNHITRGIIQRERSRNFFCYGERKSIS